MYICASCVLTKYIISGVLGLIKIERFNIFLTTARIRA